MKDLNSIKLIEKKMNKLILRQREFYSFFCIHEKKSKIQ